MPKMPEAKLGSSSRSDPAAQRLLGQVMQGVGKKYRDGNYDEVGKALIDQATSQMSGNKSDKIEAEPVGTMKAPGKKSPLDRRKPTISPRPKPIE